jgi:hypothetical protein
MSLTGETKAFTEGRHERLNIAWFSQPSRFILHTKPSAANPKSLLTLLYPDPEVTING